MYDFVFVTFTRSVTDDDLDRFAIEITRTGGAERICKVGY
jgi:hypothetical protein